MTQPDYEAIADARAEDRGERWTRRWDARYGQVQPGDPDCRCGHSRGRHSDEIEHPCMVAGCGCGEYLTDRTYPCPVCGKLLPTSRSVNQHHYRKHVWAGGS